MIADAETLTIIPAMTAFLLSIFLIFYSLQPMDPLLRNTLFIVALCLFYSGILLAICWGVYWGIHRKIP